MKILFTLLSVAWLFCVGFMIIAVVVAFHGCQRETMTPTVEPLPPKPIPLEKPQAIVVPVEPGPVIFQDQCNLAGRAGMTGHHIPKTSNWLFPHGTQVEAGDPVAWEGGRGIVQVVGEWPSGAVWCKVTEVP